MNISKWLIPATLVGVVAVAGSACTQKPAGETANSTSITVRPNPAGDKALEATKDSAAIDTKEAGEKTADASKNIAQKTGDKTKEIAVDTADKTKEIAVDTADKTKEIAGAVGSKTKEVVATTGEVITDAWITTRVSAKFVDETLLKGSDINVDTENHVVRLKGTVSSEAAKSRAVTLARNTEGVKSVVNQLIVK